MDAMGFEILTGTGETATLYCRGSVAITDQPPNKELVDLESMQQRLTFKWDGNTEARAFYERIAEKGIQYGPYFQCIEGIWASDEEGLIKVALSGSREWEHSLYQLHPALLDAAFHGIAALVPQTDGLYLPFSLKQVEPLSRPEPTMWVAILRQGPNRYDLRLVNSTGEVCVTCSGFEVRPAGHVDDDGITYLSRWVRHTRHDNQEAEQNPDDICLVVSNGKAFGFDESILSARKGAVMIRTGSRTRPLGDGAWEIDRSDLQAWEWIFAQNQPVTTLYFLCGLWDRGHHDGFTGFVRDEETVSMDFFRCIKALMSTEHGSRALNLVVLTQDVQPVYGHEPVNPTGASLSGFVQSLAKEQPRWCIKHVDISADDLRNRDNHMDLLARLNNEPGDPMGHPVAFRHGYRYTREILPVSMADNPPVKIRRSGVYVILGGAGGLGTAFSEYLIKTYDAKMIWLGRRPVDRDIQEKITRLGRYGTKPIYIQTDALDEDRMKAAYERIKTQHAMVHGVIHSAIVLRDQILQNMDEQDFKAALMPKLAGAVHLAQAFGKMSPDWICFFSSIQSVFGAPGQSNYTAGCTFKDAFGLYLRRQLNYPVHIINWGYWGETGVVAQDFYRDRLKAQGVGSLDMAGGAQTLEKVLGHDVHQILSVKLDKTKKLPVDISQSLRAEIHAPESRGVVLSVMENLPEARFESTPRILEAYRGLEAFAKESVSAVLKKKIPIATKYQKWREEIKRALNGHQPMKDFDLHGEAERLGNRYPELKSYLALVVPCMSRLEEILKGEMRATDVLFPDSSMERVAGIYGNNVVADFFNQRVADVVETYILKRLEASQDLSKIRILEVGAGTGGVSKSIFDRLAQYKDLISYTYTDVSKAFLSYGQTTFGGRVPYLKTALLDIEKPLKAQAILENHYDLVIGAHVLHATRNMAQTLLQVKGGPETKRRAHFKRAQSQFHVPDRHIRIVGWMVAV